MSLFVHGNIGKGQPLRIYLAPGSTVPQDKYNHFLYFATADNRL